MKCSYLWRFFPQGTLQFLWHMNESIETSYGLLYVFFCVIFPRLNFICRRFGTFCLFHLHRHVGACGMNSAGDMFGVLYGKRFGSEMAWAIRTEDDRVRAGQTFSRIIPQTCPQPSLFHMHLPAYEDGTECSETSAYKIQTPGNYQKEIIQHSEHGESLKSRKVWSVFYS